MSTQEELNFNAPQYILYYCNSPAGQNDPTVYQTDLSIVCSLYFDEESNVRISDWLLTYIAPSTETMLSYTLTDVLTFFDNFYTKPSQVSASQYWKLSTAALLNIRADSSMIGFGVYDTTTKTNKFFNGTAWV